MISIVVAPFSNSDIRDWQPQRFTGLIGDLLRRFDADLLIRLIGTRSQRLRACEIVRAFPATHVHNDCGRLSWPAVVDEVRSASCVIGNNSGIAHLAASLGVPTVCIFGGSHQRLEWRPLGPHVVTITRALGCSPCHLDHGASCRYDKLCLSQIEPQVVTDAVLALVRSRGHDVVRVEHLAPSRDTVLRGRVH